MAKYDGKIFALLLSESHVESLVVGLSVIFHIPLRIVSWGQGKSPLNKLSHRGMHDAMLANSERAIERFCRRSDSGSGPE